MIQQSLKEAFERVSKLPPEQQEEIAAFIADELAAERRWAELLSRSPEKLAAMADEALHEHRRGETRPFEADSDLADN